MPRKKLEELEEPDELEEPEIYIESQEPEEPVEPEELPDLPIKLELSINYDFTGTSNFIIIDDELYYINPVNLKNIKVTIRNWQKYFTDWEKIEKEWVRRLNSKCEGKKGKPSAFAILDMPSNGHCLFTAISTAFNLHNKKEIYKPKDIRDLTADQLNQERFDFIMDSFKSADEVGELEEDINFDEIKTVEDLKELLKTEDVQFWGDYSCILFIQEAMNINIIVLGDNNKVYPLLEEFNREKETVILHYIEGLHFQLVGYFNNLNIQTVFKYNEIPTEIKQVYEEDCCNSI